MKRARKTGVRPKRPVWRVVLASLAAVAFLGTVAVVGAWAWLTRPQGDAQATEFSEAQLSQAMLGAKVLALGEATHGNAEYQRLRTEVLAKTVDHGFRTVVLEEDYGQTHAVDTFIQGGPGTAEEAAQRFGFRINKTRQVADWLQWMRDYNETVAPHEKIRLVGMDVQRTEGSLKLVAEALKDTAPEVARKASAEGDDLTPATLAAARRALSDVPIGQRNDADMAVTALEQHLRLREAGTAYGTVRDRAMFSNLERVVAKTDGGVLVMAHNGHVAKAPTGALTESVGRQAAAAWGAKYRVIGTDFHHTRFLSGTADDRQEWSLTNRTPLRGMYEGTQVGYLEIAGTTGTNRELFTTPQPMGNAGEAFTRIQQLVPFFHLVYDVPSALYDAVVLVDDATPVTML